MLFAICVVLNLIRAKYIMPAGTVQKMCLSALGSGSGSSVYDDYIGVNATGTNSSADFNVLDTVGFLTYERIVATGDAASDLVLNETIITDEASLDCDGYIVLSFGAVLGAMLSLSILCLYVHICRRYEDLIHEACSEQGAYEKDSDDLTKYSQLETCSPASSLYRRKDSLDSILGLEGDEESPRRFVESDKGSDSDADSEYRRSKSQRKRGYVHVIHSLAETEETEALIELSSVDIAHKVQGTLRGGTVTATQSASAMQNAPTIHKTKSAVANEFYEARVDAFQANQRMEHIYAASSDSGKASPRKKSPSRAQMMSSTMSIVNDKFGADSKVSSDSFDRFETQFKSYTNSRTKSRANSDHRAHFGTAIKENEELNDDFINPIVAGLGTSVGRGQSRRSMSGKGKLGLTTSFYGLDPASVMDSSRSQKTPGTVPKTASIASMPRTLSRPVSRALSQTATLAKLSINRKTSAASIVGVGGFKKHTIHKDTQDSDVRALLADKRLAKLYSRCRRQSNEHHYIVMRARLHELVFAWTSQACNTMANYCFGYGRRSQPTLAPDGFDGGVWDTSLTKKFIQRAEPLTEFSHADDAHVDVQNEAGSGKKWGKGARLNLSSSNEYIYRLVEATNFLKSIYLAFWACQLVPVATASSPALSTPTTASWIVILTLPLLVHMYLFPFLLAKAVMTQSLASVLDEDVVLSVFEESFHAEGACLDLRNSIKYTLTLSEVDPIRWKSYIMMMCEKYSTKTIVASTPESMDGGGGIPSVSETSGIVAALTAVSRSISSVVSRERQPTNSKQVHRYLDRKGFRLFLASLEIFLDVPAFETLWRTIDLNSSNSITWDEIYLVAYPEYRRHLRTYLAASARILAAIDASVLEIQEQSLTEGTTTTTRSVFVNDCYEYFDPRHYKGFIMRQQVSIILSNLGLTLTPLEESTIFAFVGMSQQDTQVSWKCYLAIMDPSNPLIDRIVVRPILRTMIMSQYENEPVIVPHKGGGGGTMSMAGFSGGDGRQAPVGALPLTDILKRQQPPVSQTRVRKPSTVQIIRNRRESTDNESDIESFSGNEFPL
jgi:hypothetical protein